MFRTDQNNNPTAFTTDMAKLAKLTLGTDYLVGNPFNAEGHTYYTAKLIGDPIAQTIKVIDKVGFYTSSGNLRWIYIGIPYEVWLSLNSVQKKNVIGYMYSREGGETMKGLFS